MVAKKASDAARQAPSRLDALLVKRGLAGSRARAQALVMAGQVKVNGAVETKAGARVPDDAELTVEGGSRFVSRAGEKLAHALDAFGVPVEDRDCFDAGASTGGFTDALLQRGARRVISADVGYGQLDWRLRNDPRVHVMERTNVRYLSGEDLPFAPDLLVADLSFISLAVALQNLVSTTPEMGEAVVLVKPQFEAGPEQVGRRGIVRDPAARAEAIWKAARALEAFGLYAVGVTRSPVVGRKSGNQEYLLRLLRGGYSTLHEDDVRRAVVG